MALQLGQGKRVGHSAHFHSWAGDTFGDDKLFFFAGVVHQHLHHEAVDLRFGQRVGAFGLDRVLCRHHHKRVGHFVRFTGNRDLAFLHHFEQGALHFGRGAVDLIGQQQVGEHGA